MMMAHATPVVSANPASPVGPRHRRVRLPAGTPAAPMQKLVRALQAALKNPDLGKRFADINTEPIGERDATPEALRVKLLSEIDRWAPIIKEAGQFAD